jgi:ligand-binding SRPBCC domain-containing protein
MGRVQGFERRQRIERPIEEVFAFFGDARNLERITLIFDYRRDGVAREMSCAPG